MEEERKLYPLKFCSILDEYQWGSEDFRLADLGYRDSLVKEGWLAGNTIGEVMDTFMDRVSGDNVYEHLGRQFPICVRRIRTTGRMPLRVSPDDVTAQERYDFLGKEKLWYIVSAGRNARVMAGFKNDSDAGALYQACLDNDADKLLNVVVPHAGQVFHIAPGTVHAAEGEMEILEIAESSPLDFCLCGWGKEVSTDEFDESLSMVDALDFIDYKAYKADRPTGDTLLSTPQFEVRTIDLKNPLKVSGGAFESFAVYSCVKGGVSMGIDILGQKAAFRLGEGETFLVPAECSSFELEADSPDTILLETSVPYTKDIDEYINPDVPATLENE